MTADSGTETPDERNARYVREFGISYDELRKRIEACERGEFMTSEEVSRMFDGWEGEDGG